MPSFQPPHPPTEGSGTPPALPRLARETTKEHPWPLAKLSENIKIYIEKMSPLWVEAQIVQLADRGATKMSFLTLRDVEQDMSMEVSAFGNVISASGAPITPGSRVVAYVKPTYWLKSGRLALQAKEIHPVGLGDLLARIEKLRQQLQSEGLFDDTHKKPLPFLPRKIGLICGNNAKAKDDVLVNATARWPGAQFEIREVLVQGTGAVAGVSKALAELDALADVEVIVIARGGGSVEDLLPFSDETLVRAVFAARTPVVSAIGHEGDSPLIDLVADYRASTPTDAARRIVPDLVAENQGLTNALQELRHRFQTRLNTEAQHLQLLLERPVLTTPAASLKTHFESLENARTKLNHAVSLRLTQAQAELNAAFSTLRAISPQATLERGYAIIKAPGKGVLTDASNVKKGEILEARLAKGSMIVTVFGTNKTEPDSNE
ncbi:exodeoxyribonuclease VII large subunit [Gleimia sp. 6138-11-ORH1]|uniref:exodeoxyribonuclease VII large subunit n=1 Tax=Gleimia sp. 6138-11-ORH1 TaxID=2973937 RepID=UPI002167840E|nr:exodeoxyribonuclease VII large subunit [Gleimia sp. 6138-11-ORH1]MCS4485225.1 exodeoxyribonuclease VII large subunit [Gleimia sp. 6138-11-ORH1]